MNGAPTHKRYRGTFGTFSADRERARSMPHVPGESSTRLHGTEADIVWGYRPAIVLRAWAIAKRDGVWRLTARVARIDAFQSRQRPLIFTAYRDRNSGRWAWPVLDLQLGSTELRATLGPPEH